MSEDLRRIAVRAIGATTAGSGLAKVISLLSTLVLARLLTPGDFGLMAIATTVVGFIGFFNEVGIGAAIVQRTQVRDEEINGCFGIAMLASTLLCGVAVALSWPLASIFSMPNLQPVLAVLGFGFFFGAVNTVPFAILRRDLRLQAVLWLGVTSAIVQAIIAIPIAFFGLGYWALVISFFVGQTISTLWLWRVVKWRPSLPLHLREGRALLGYGLDVTYTRVLWHFYMNADTLIVGKLLGERAVGIYDVSKSLASLPTSQITGMVISIASPVFSRLQADLPRLQVVLLRFTRGVAYLTFPALAGIAVVADQLVLVFLGPQWIEAAWPLRALCISEMVRSVAYLQSQLLISTGHVRRAVVYNAICAASLPLAIAAGAWLDGLRGVSVAWATAYPLLALWLLREALTVSQLRYVDFWHAVRHPLFGTGAMVLAVLATDEMLDSLAWPTAIGLACSIAVAALTYVAYLILIDREGMNEIRQVLGDLGVPIRHLNHWPFSHRIQPGRGRT